MKMSGLRNKIWTIKSIYRNSSRNELFEACDEYIKKHWAPLPTAYGVRTKFALSPPQDDRIFRIRVDPEDIAYTSSISRSTLPMTGEDAIVGVVGGRWDRYRKNFRDTDMYLSIEQRFVDGVSWEETPRIKQKIRRNADEADIDRECEKIEELFDVIDRHGYLSQDELSKSDGEKGWIRKRRKIRSIETPDEIVVGLCRDGSLMRLGGGRHRLAIAQVLGVDEIPAILTLRHDRAASDGIDFEREYVARPITDEAGGWSPVID